MRLPSRIKVLLRRYESALFWDEGSSREERLQGFYKLLNPSLGWLKERLRALGLSSLEVESEVYILCCEVYSGFDRERSSIVPYLEKRIPWYTRYLYRRVMRSRLKEEPIGLTYTQGTTSIKESFNWESLILNNSWGGKDFTRSQKYLIHIVLTSDDNKLSQRALANTINIDIRRMKAMIKELRDNLTLEDI